MAGGQSRRPEELLRRFGIQKPRHINLEALAYHCGAEIRYEELSGCEARILGNNDQAIITVNSRSQPMRQRFSIAHELGHWVYDRGIVGFACTGRDFVTGWNRRSPERRANKYAADLLLPRFMFEPDAHGRPVSFDTVKELADRYWMSLTATAIRLVEYGSFPSMLVCCSAEYGRRWYTKHPDVPRFLFPHYAPGKQTVAQCILHESGAAGHAYVPADQWIDHPSAERYLIREESIPMGSNLTLTLLWWEDQTHLIEVAGLDE